MMWSKTKIPAYQGLASIYDDVMAHVDYEYWAEYVHELVLKHGSGNFLYDISCGTGTCCAELHNLGYYVLGSDVSLPMVMQAELKFAETPLQDRFFCTSMDAPAVRMQADVVISLYDSINYLLTEKQWQNCLLHVAQLLKPGGLFIFDVSTIYNSTQEFANLVQREKLHDASFLRKSTFDVNTNIQKNMFEIQFKEFPNQVFTETHVQKIRSLDQVRQFVDASPLQFVNAYQEFTFKKYDETCERVHFVLTKPN